MIIIVIVTILALLLTIHFGNCIILLLSIAGIQIKSQLLIK